MRRGHRPFVTFAIGDLGLIIEGLTYILGLVGLVRDTLGGPRFALRLEPRVVHRLVFIEVLQPTSVPVCSCPCSPRAAPPEELASFSACSVALAQAHRPGGSRWPFGAGWSGPSSTNALRRSWPFGGCSRGAPRAGLGRLQSRGRSRIGVRGLCRILASQANHVFGTRFSKRWASGAWIPCLPRERSFSSSGPL